MKILITVAIVVFGVGLSEGAFPSGAPAGGDTELLRIDRATFAASPAKLSNKLLDTNFTWTDSSGNTRNKSEVLRAIPSAERPVTKGNLARPMPAVAAHVYGEVGVVQENVGYFYIMHIWVKNRDGWRALVYQAVKIGAAASFEAAGRECKNPCEMVPFEPRNEAEREVIQGYQAVERAVAAQDSKAWGAHIADEFFAVTSNSDRPLDKRTRMEGLDNQKVAGIAPFPLVSARMFEFGNAMVMISRQQPERGLPLHVTRVWFKRNGAWLEAYSYQTTIQTPGSSQSQPARRKTEP
jgi:hypothetical protein